MTTSDDIGSDEIWPEGHERGGPLFWVSAVAGAALVVVGVAGILGDANRTRPGNLARWVLGAGVAHDALFAPAAVAVGWATSWLLPPLLRLPVRIGLAITTLFVLVAWPAVRGYGVNPRNPSLLPLDYGRNLVLALGVVWIGVAAAVILRAARGSRS